MVSKARVGNGPLQLDYTEAGIILELIPEDPPEDLSLPHQHRHPENDEAEEIIIFIGQDPPHLQLTPDYALTDFSHPELN